MKKAALALISASLSLGTVLSPAVAHADPGKEIRVAGYTQWLETYSVIRELHDTYGIPVTDDLCRPHEQYCIRIEHINKPNGQAGLTRGTTGNATITLNNYYARGSHNYRRQVLLHEFGHALGLWEHSDCSSAMEPQIAMCGKFVLGYNAEEQQKLRETWG